LQVGEAQMVASFWMITILLEQAPVKQDRVVKIALQMLFQSNFKKFIITGHRIPTSSH
jgi:hypothetical protein